MLAVTAHGSLYCFNPAAAAPTQKCSQFIIPPQTILDTMLTQTQSLEQVYKQMSLEDELVKAVSTASVANSLPSLFSVKIHVLSGKICTPKFVAKLKILFCLKSIFNFAGLLKLWLCPGAYRNFVVYFKIDAIFIF